MKRSFGRSASPIAAVVVLAALLTSACAAGQNAASATPASTPSASTTLGGERRRGVSDDLDQPSPTRPLLTWTKASLEEDWPAPVRTEPAGPATILPVSPEGEGYPDPTGDTESGAFPWVDIHWVGIWSQQRRPTWSRTTGRSWIPPSSGSRMASSSTTIATASPTGGSGWTTCPSDPSGWAANPDSEQMVRDDLAIGGAPFSAWRTDLHTGRTEWTPGPPYVFVGETHFGDSWTRFRFGERFPGRHRGHDARRALLRLGLGDHGRPGRGHGLCPGRRVAPPVARREALSVRVA